MSTCDVTLCPIELTCLTDSQPKCLKFIPHTLQFIFHSVDLRIFLLILYDELSDSLLLLLQLPLQLLSTCLGRCFLALKLPIPLSQSRSKALLTGFQVEDLGLKVTRLTLGTLYLRF